MGFLQWEFWVAFPGESKLWQSHPTQPTAHAGSFSFFHNPPNSDMDYRIFNLCKDVNALLLNDNNTYEALLNAYISS